MSYPRRRVSKIKEKMDSHFRGNDKSKSFCVKMPLCKESKYLNFLCNVNELTQILRNRYQPNFVLNFAAYLLLMINGSATFFNLSSKLAL